MNTLLPYAATALGPALRNLSRKRLLALGKYAYNRGAFYHSKYNTLSKAQKAFLNGTARRAMAGLRRKKRRARTIAAFRNTKRPRMTRQITSRWAGRDIRILRKSSVVVQNMYNWINNALVAQAITNDPTNYDPLPLTTIRTYEPDEPFFFDVSSYIRRTALPLLNADDKQSSVDIESITFFMTFINYQPDVDIDVRAMLLNRKVRMHITGSESNKDDHNSINKSVSGKGWDDFWNDRVDKFEKHDFTNAFEPADYSPNYKDYAQPNSSEYKIWKQTNIRVYSNPHGNEAWEDYRTLTMNTNAQGETAPAVVTQDMGFNRIRANPGQNEKQTVLTWKPKGGFRFQFQKLDKTSSEPDAEPWVPKQDLRFLIMPFEVTKDIMRKSTQHPLGYRLEVTVKYKDLL